MNIEQYLNNQKIVVDKALFAFLAENKEFPPKLEEAIEYSLKAGGKRIRPILALAAAQAVGGAIEPVLPLACAMEMIHTFSLIHDDLPAMDNDDFRRGKPTNHKVYGEGVAILAGDALLSEAFYLLCHPNIVRQISPNVLIDVIRDVAHATGRSGMVGGQILDLEGEGKKSDADALEKIHHYKTGCLITTSITSGAKIAGANGAQLEALKIYGEKVGLAFQIADDILNVEGTKENLGKSVGSDQQHNKSTYPSLFGLTVSKKMAQDLAEQAVSVLEIFDAKADPLRGIAQYIVSRKN
ncbi:MAG: polyprenyl synthetase [Deltaproteobacteria bacterium RIFCSPLOWO2_02_FULL_46_8]|nr:MAG: polyprenyl synthetase [Deltaproteobacteria bacterium RIFCSPLOWO2_02_FULL_46_8]